MNENINNLRDELKSIIEKTVPTVPNTAPIAKQHQEIYSPSTEYKFDFSKAANDFWYTQGPNKIKNYQTGRLIGKHTSSSHNQNLDQFADLFIDTLLELIKSECKKQNKQINNEILEILKNTVLLTFKTISTKNNLNDVLAYLHGFINSFIESNNESQMQKM